VSPRDPATSTTFVRGSSGRLSWRMVPHSKRAGSAVSSVDTAQTTTSTKVPVVAQEMEVSEVKNDLVAMPTDTPPPPPKAYRLTQTFEDESEEGVDEEVEAEIVHTSSFSFPARDGRLVGTH
jgi:hypothetical protein